MSRDGHFDVRLRFSVVRLDDFDLCSFAVFWILRLVFSVALLPPIIGFRFVPFAGMLNFDLSPMSNWSSDATDVLALKEYLDV